MCIFFSLSLTGKHAFANVTERVLEARCEKRKKKEEKKKESRAKLVPPSGTDMLSAGPELNLVKLSETGDSVFQRCFNDVFRISRCPTSTVRKATTATSWGPTSASSSRQRCSEGSLWMFFQNLFGGRNSGIGGREFRQRQIHAPTFSAEPDGGTGCGQEGWVSADTSHFPPKNSKAWPPLAAPSRPLISG